MQRPYLVKKNPEAKLKSAKTNQECALWSFKLYKDTMVSEAQNMAHNTLPEKKPTKSCDILNKLNIIHIIMHIKLSKL